MSNKSHEDRQQKSRLPIERAIVWGLILVLLLVVVLEARARFGFSRSFKQLTQALRAADSAAAEVTESDVLRILGHKQPRESQPAGRLGYVATRIDTYIWSGLIRRYTMYIYYGMGDDPTVLTVTPERERSADVLYPPPTAEQIAKQRRRSMEAAAARVPMTSDMAPRPLDDASDGSKRNADANQNRGDKGSTVTTQQEGSRR